jgi:hypothetical protein
MAATNYLKTKIMEDLLGKVAFTPATPLYFGLCTGVDADGTIHGEPTENEYARVSKTNNQTTFPACNPAGVIENGVAIAFPTCVTDWGTLTHWFISDALTGNTNTLLFGTLNAPKTVETGDIPTIGIGDLILSLR